MPVLPLVASTTVCPGFSGAVALCLLDDVEGQPVLHRRSRIEELGFRIDVSCSGREIIDPDCRRVADRVEDTVEEPAAPVRRSDCRLRCHDPFPLWFFCAKCASRTQHVRRRMQLFDFHDRIKTWGHRGNKRGNARGICIGSVDRPCCRRLRADAWSPDNDPQRGPSGTSRVT